MKKLLWLLATVISCDAVTTAEECRKMCYPGPVIELTHESCVCQLSQSERADGGDGGTSR